MEWDKITLDKLGSVSRGRSKHRPRNDESLFNGIYPFIQTGDVKRSGLHIVDYTETYNEKGLAQSKLWAPGTLCITIAANIADTSILSFPACFPDSIIGFVADKEKSDVRFIKYSFDILQKKCQAISLGATQDNLSWEKLSKIKFDIPSLSIQHCIASILSAYDNLIENNNKRIRLLEQMAENLYKEWFVRFRFPGHENAEFENGLPKGWSLKNLFDVADVSYGYAFKSDLFCNDKNLNAVVRIRDIQDNHTDTYTSEVCDDKYLIEENAILVGMDGLFHMCLWNGEKAYLNQRVVKICSKKKDMCNYMIFMAIRPQIKFWEQVIAGTTVAHLGDKHLKKIKIAVPTENLLLKANESIQRIMVEKNQLFKQNQILSRQRDLLLPRLMSGKLEVKV